MAFRASASPIYEPSIFERKIIKFPSLLTPETTPEREIPHELNAKTYGFYNVYFEDRFREMRNVVGTSRAKILCEILDLFVETRADPLAHSLLISHLAGAEFPAGADDAFIKDFVPYVFKLLEQGFNIDNGDPRYLKVIFKIKQMMESNNIASISEELTDAFMEFFSIVDYTNVTNPLLQQEF